MTSKVGLTLLVVVMLASTLACALVGGSKPSDLMHQASATAYWRAMERRPEVQATLTASAQILHVQLTLQARKGICIPMPCEITNREAATK